jgi:hypothetical protein
MCSSYEHPLVRRCASSSMPPAVHLYSSAACLLNLFNAACVYNTSSRHMPFAFFPHLSSYFRLVVAFSSLLLEGQGSAFAVHPPLVPCCMHVMMVMMMMMPRHFFSIFAYILLCAGNTIQAPALLTQPLGVADTYNP